MDLNDLLVRSAHIIVHFGLLREVNADWIHSRLHVDDWRRGGEENGVFEVLHLQGGGHDDELQLRVHFSFGIKLRAERNDAREQAEKKIGVEIALVRFIQNNRAVGAKNEV